MRQKRPVIGSEGEVEPVLNLSQLRIGHSIPEPHSVHPQKVDAGIYEHRASLGFLASMLLRPAGLPEIEFARDR